MSDISNTVDIEKLMTLFYDRLLVNPITAPVFASTDMKTHMPRVVAFWDGIAFGGGTYRGVPTLAKLKERARSIAFIFSHKLGLAPPEI